MLKKIALCIPTKDRFKCIKEFIDDLKRVNLICDFDVFIFDSSDNGRVKEYLDTLKVDKVKYVKVDTYVDEKGIPYRGVEQAAIKYLNIYKYFTCINEYEYIWIYGDGIRCSDTLWGKVCEVCKKGYDVITISQGNQNQLIKNDKRDVEYVSPVEYLKYNTADNTLFGAFLFRIELLKRIDFEKIEAWYYCRDYLPFSYIILIEKIVKMIDYGKTFSIYVAGGISWSRFKLDIGWRKDFVDVYYKSFIMAIQSFEVEQDVKKYIIEEFYKNNRYDKNDLKIMLAKGIISKDEINKWGYYIRLNFGNECVDELSSMSIDELQKWYSEKTNRFWEICKSHKTIYIWGTGKIAEQVLSIFEIQGVKIGGVIVSSDKYNIEEFMGYRIHIYEKIREELEDVMVIVCVSENSLIEIQKNYDVQKPNFLILDSEMLACIKR